MSNGRSGGKGRSRRTKQNKDEKGGRTVKTAAPALFAFMGPVSSSVGLSAWRSACASPRCGNGWFRSGQRKAIIRTHHRLEIGSDYVGLVRAWGLEPQRRKAREPKSRMSTNSIIPAYMGLQSIIPHSGRICKRAIAKKHEGTRFTPWVLARWAAAVYNGSTAHSKEGSICPRHVLPPFTTSVASAAAP